MAKAKDILDGAAYLKFADLENMFDVFLDQRGAAYYNLNETAYVAVDPSSLPVYMPSHRMQWPLVSYSLYGSTRLAWLLMHLNGVGADRAFDAVEPGQKVLYLDLESARNVVKALNERR